MEIANRARQAFRERFGEEPEVVAFAPGRINLIGEHTDYNDGYVFPIAIDKGIAVAASKSRGSTDMLSLEAGEGEPFETEKLSPQASQNWTKYAAGMAWAIERELGSKMPNLRVVVHGDLPFASGVSSSAALEVAFGRVYEKLGGLMIPAKELARIAHVCETEYVGVKCGIMDMTASACGMAGHAMMLDTRSKEIRYVKIPEDLTIVLCDTGTARALSDSPYNERRRQCEGAALVLGVHALRDIKPEELLAREGELGDVEFRRAKHVTTENERCLQFVDALEAADRDWMGRLMAASHASLRDDYEVTSKELDAMVEGAMAYPGCIGARMTGAGFGGACVAVVDTTVLRPFLIETELRYALSSGSKGRFMACQASDGARLME